MCASLALMIRSKFLLMGSAHNPSSMLMEGWGVTDNLNSCLSWGALQISIWLVKCTCALHPAPSLKKEAGGSQKHWDPIPAPCLNILIYTIWISKSLSMSQREALTESAMCKSLAQCWHRRVSQGQQPHLSSSQEPAPQPFTACHCPNTKLFKANILKQKRQQSTPNDKFIDYLPRK